MGCALPGRHTHAVPVDSEGSVDPVNLIAGIGPTSMVQAVPAGTLLSPSLIKAESRATCMDKLPARHTRMTSRRLRLPTIADSQGAAVEKTPPIDTINL